MNHATGFPITLGGQTLVALPEKGLWWPEAHTLVVSDLHLGKAERIARRGGALIPPYETQETLERLEDLVSKTSPRHVICLGDSFDDTAAIAALGDEITLRLTRLMAGRRWTWILGNHDPGPVTLGGTCSREIAQQGLTFRHIADPDTTTPEISGHYHPKASAGGRRRPAFVTDGTRLILPAFGTYTGGLDVSDPAISALFGEEACAILTGRTMAPIPLAACRSPSAGPPVRWARGLTG